ncbi:SPOR domain-containing protein [Aliivibrio fischeri]|uniref:SPOR domain-containing protein n=1 Tax=Aliivibrio fischeri TaxID=668 RepID=UPI0007C57B96|nr:SPOR domain-containing protein [Aliivibrio fischeri]MCE7555947.1 SPOR domain-containing protein [Aliivibrio fischeri]MCE7562913.1 SPOR domain-containing protein [Aliivibrio fischeri]MCE7566976.1 SPOR domain-containing protein [Aliivibrio fischeri]MCE7570882.1 SPOR domain-containing protein [Aliivibrio fischeri]TGA68118.1 SPOR domain-containing protein [Aliivibrio fischeri]
MKRIIPITLTALLAGCTSSSYTTNITTDSSEEVYQVTQPIEQEETTFEETEVVAVSEAEKPVVKLTPEETATPEVSDAAVKILPPTEKQQDMHNRYGYTLQILALSRKTDLSTYAAKLSGEQPVWMNRKTVNNMPWYTILYGDYATPAEARAAIKQLPADIQAYGPFVRSINSIKQSDNPELHKLN